MQIRKRQLSSPEVQVGRPGPKRARLPQERTKTTWNEIRAAYHIDEEQMSLHQFTTLCAYLCTLLQWGYHIKARDLDHFIVSYGEFAESLDNMRQLAMRTGAELPAYHQWLRHHRNPLFLSRRLLSEQVLREVWRENVYTFLHTKFSLNFIAWRQLNLKYANAQHQ